ncbi:unnamed protein product [Rotaria sp. Silwood2]|nr:unnamed protein product [Rotaria sp. Silwood2]CAF2549479.1 unnamed protein product [Rotaria sp. Silwood2]CAF4107152.1 unnamed protein product [Rotaria sp. Silwood2]CAF4298103.1 unnamed protein product [Rotaria sp. Silwood2]
MEDNNQNNNGKLVQQQSPASTEETPVTPSNYRQQMQLLEINGQLYAPIDQDYHNKQKIHKQTNKYVYDEAPPMTMMIHQCEKHIANNNKDNNIDFVDGNEIITTDNGRHLQDKPVSTPKRNIDQLNRSNEQRKKIRNEKGNLQQQPMRNITNLNTTSSKQNLNTLQINDRKTATQLNAAKSYDIPIEQLKRAIGHNLPCFLIEFDNNVAARDLPSAIIACDLIKDHFYKNKVDINNFSVASFIGHRLKLGVNNMEDYSTLIRTEKWPTLINGKKMAVIKPKFVPECFTLVVRYVPQSVTSEMVSEEIKRSISSASNFKQILYSYSRSSNDYRFTVSDLTEYEGALKIGRLCIANRFHPITKYLPANKLTFCTKCWCIGHLRPSCISNVAKCRICLKNYDHDHLKKCSSKPICANCGLDHHSLDPKCNVVRNYRQKLNEEVKKAISDGTLNRRTIQMSHQHQQSTSDLFYDRDYPALPGNSNMKMINNSNAIWPCVNDRISTNSKTMSTNTIVSMLAKINKDFKTEIVSLKETILQKLDEKININASNLQLHHVSLCTINSTIDNLLKKVIWPLVEIIPDSNAKEKNEILTAFQDLEKPFNIHAEHLRKDFNYNFLRNTHQLNSLITSPSNIMNNQSPLLTTTNDTPSLMEQSDSSREDNQS